MNNRKFQSCKKRGSRRADNDLRLWHLFPDIDLMPSSVIESIKYDPVKEILRVVFLSGSVYDYKKVPASVYQAMKAATSKGTFLNRKIKGYFDYEKRR